MSRRRIVVLAMAFALASLLLLALALTLALPTGSNLLNGDVQVSATATEFTNPFHPGGPLLICRRTA